MSTSKHVFSICLLLTTLFSASVFAEADIDRTFNYHGGAGLAALPGPHAITSMTSDSGSSTMNYDANGDLVEVTGDMTLCQEYSVIRKPKRHSKEARRTDGSCRGTTAVEILYTATGEKLAVLSEGTLDVFMGDGVRVTNGKIRLAYGGVSEESEAGELLYRAKDHLGSIVAVANKQQILQRMDYLPYGEVWYSDIDGHTDRDFNGNLKQNDLLDYNARHYHPVLGKFIQADSIVPKVDAVGFNRYAYVSNNPLNRIDPSGHSETDPYIGWTQSSGMESGFRYINDNPMGDDFGYTFGVELWHDTSIGRISYRQDLFTRPWYSNNSATLFTQEYLAYQELRFSPSNLPISFGLGIRERGDPSFLSPIHVQNAWHSAFASYRFENVDREGRQVYPIFEIGSYEMSMKSNRFEFEVFKVGATFRPFSKAPSEFMFTNYFGLRAGPFSLGMRPTLLQSLGSDDVRGSIALESRVRVSRGWRLEASIHFYNMYGGEEGFSGNLDDRTNSWHPNSGLQYEKNFSNDNIVSIGIVRAR